jgi:hypothetical protein
LFYVDCQNIVQYKYNENRCDYALNEKINSRFSAVSPAFNFRKSGICLVEIINWFLENFSVHILGNLIVKQRRTSDLY